MKTETKRKPKTKRYAVTLYYHSCAYVEVRAKSAADAVAKARRKATYEDIRNNLEEEPYPETKELE